MNILPPERQIQLLEHLIDGCGIRATERLTGVNRNTIMRWLVILGHRAQRFLNSKMRNLRLRHVQLDEQWTYVYAKSRNLQCEPVAGIGDYWIFIALDQDTRLVPAWHVGRRDEDNTIQFVEKFRDTLWMPNPHASDSHHFARGQYQHVVTISSDGWGSYRGAIAGIFGPHARYGQVVKDTATTDRKWPLRRVVQGPLDPMKISTSLVERNNLTRRHFMRRMARQCLCFSKKLENLEAAVALHLLHYNYCWRLRKPGKSGQLTATPAMMAGVCDRLYTVEDIFWEMHTI